MADELFGKTHRAVLERLAGSWRSQGPPVCFLEGFPGVGKSNAIVRRLRARLAQQEIRTVSLDMPEPGISQADDLLLGLAQELDLVGIPDVAEALDDGKNLESIALAFRSILGRPVLVVWDEFQRALDLQTGEPLPFFKRLLSQIGNRSESAGRLLLLTNRNPRRGQWSDPHSFLTVSNLDPTDGLAFLNYLLREAGRETEIPPERRPEVVAWVGGNPRALQLVVSALAGEPLESLIGLRPETWELRDQEVSPLLIEDLERELLHKILEQLDDGARQVLSLAAVYRQPVKREVLERLAPTDVEPERLRRELVDRHLLDHNQGFYTLNRVAQEVSRRALQADPALLKRAHRLAGEYYARAFQGVRIVGGGARSGGNFVEARYHLVQAGREEELAGIASRFAGHLRSEITWVAPVPSDPRELAERIAVLSAFLAQPGPKGLEHHLARCLDARRQGRDLEHALEHSRKATGPQSPPEAWNLRVRLEREIEGSAAALKATREGLRWLPEDAALYQAGANAFLRANRLDEARELLHEGIERVPPEKSLFSLYQSAAEILARQNKLDEAVGLLQQGIERVPPEKSLISLYQSAAEILARQNKLDEAVGLLRQGIQKIPPEKNVFSLYQSAAEILACQNKIDEAINLLRQGLSDIPRAYSRHKLAEAGLYISVAARRADLIEALLASKGEDSLDAQGQALGRNLLLQLAGRWAQAAEVASLSRKEFPRLISLAIQEAFCWLCANQPREAAVALERFPIIKKSQDNNPSAWLNALISLLNGDPEGTRDHYSSYLGRPVEEVGIPTTIDLLRLWDSPVPLSTPHPSYYFSTLPPSLTGLLEPITRPPTKESVLPGILLEKRGASPASVSGPSRNILAVATEWSSRHGGLSTLNRELCAALAGAGHRVVCVVPVAGAEEVESARARNVLLVPGPPESGESEELAPSRPPSLPEGFEPDLILGHGRITGPAARALAADFNAAARIHMVHMAPGEIEWLKERPGAAARSEDRERLELDLAMEAALVVAVGPRLYRETANLLDSRPGFAPRVHRLDPGFLPGALRQPPTGIQVLVLGRAEDRLLKGLDIAARAMAALPHPDQRPFESDPVLIVRGAPAGTGDDLRHQLRNLAPVPGDRLRIREYTADVERIIEDLNRSSLLLMPSRVEGFGLVGLEAIAAGTPVLVSDRSGLGELLLEHLGHAEAASFVVRIEDNLDADAREWSRAIEGALRDRKAAFARAEELRAKLAAKLTWERAVVSLFEALENARPVAEHATPV